MKNTTGCHYQNGRLLMDGVSLGDLSTATGTPLYVYSQSLIEQNFLDFQKAFQDIPHLICYALKANSNHAILETLAKLGGGADIVSGGELFRARKAGIPASRIVFAGVGKTVVEIESALRQQIMMMNVESREELLLIQRVAERLNRVAPIALRVNPDIDPKTHPYISTGLHQHKFGIAISSALDHYRLAASLSHLRIEGIHMHLGSQILSFQPYREALKKALHLIDRLARENIRIRYLDMGGGLGIDYEHDKRSLTPKQLSATLAPLLRGRDLTLLFEPGRSIVANAGILLTKVLFVKQGAGKRFVIVDAGMNDFIRPSLYDAFHEIIPVQKSRRRSVIADIVGPVCETGDFFAKERKIAMVKPGDLLAIRGAGAYGFSMSSNYNSRPRCGEVMIRGTKAVLVREAETFQDLIRHDQLKFVRL